MYRIIFIPIVVLLASCVGDYYIDDFVEPTISISTDIDTIGVGESAQIDFRYLNNVGRLEELTSVNWSSSDSEILTITDGGVITGQQKGSAFISLDATVDGFNVSDAVTINVGENTVENERTLSKSGVLRTTSQYLLAGSFTLEAQSDGTLLLTYGDDFQATRSLPQLHGFLSNNPNSFQGAYDLGPTTIFEGSHTVSIGPGIDIDEYSFITYWCVPFRVKVGDATIE